MYTKMSRIAGAALISASLLSGCAGMRFQPLSTRDVPYSEVTKALNENPDIYLGGGSVVKEDGLTTVLLDRKGGLNFDGKGFSLEKTALERMKELIKRQYENIPDNRVTAVYNQEGKIEAIVIPRGTYTSYHDTERGEFSVNAVEGGTGGGSGSGSGGAGGGAGGGSGGGAGGAGA